MQQGAAERIAVIDGESSIRDMVQLGLSQEGFEVRTAVDGPDGLTLVRDWQPDDRLDVMMPKIDGISLIPLIRRLTEVPILMLTARGDVRDRIDGLKAGADDYLPNRSSSVSSRPGSRPRCGGRCCATSSTSPTPIWRSTWRRARSGAPAASSTSRRASSIC